jgi:hypothetical protein
MTNGQSEKSTQLLPLEASQSRAKTFLKGCGSPTSLVSMGRASTSNHALRGTSVTTHPIMVKITPFDKSTQREN